MPRRWMKRALIVGLAVTPLSCDPASTPRAPTPPASERASEQAQTQAQAQAQTPAQTDTTPSEAVLGWLRGQEVREGRWARRELYTWTRAEQIAELRSGQPLLSRSRSTDGRPSAFDRALEGDPHPLARRLHAPPFNLQRFAWANPWATRRGWEGADYGDRLIRVRLREGSWIARFDPSASGAERWSAVDLEGQIVPREALAASPERVAAVYHLGRGEGPRPALFREYVLVHEARLVSFEVGGEALSERLRGDAEGLRALAAALRRRPSPPPPIESWTDHLASAWRSAGEEEEGAPLSLYARALAFSDPLYRPTPEQLEALASALAVPREESYRREIDPAALERAQRPARVRPAPPPRRDPTYARGWDPTL